MPAMPAMVPMRLGRLVDAAVGAAAGPSPRSRPSRAPSSASAPSPSVYNRTASDARPPTSASLPRPRRTAAIPPRSSPRSTRCKNTNAASMAPAGRGLSCSTPGRRRSSLSAPAHRRCRCTEWAASTTESTEPCTKSAGRVHRRAVADGLMAVTSKPAASRTALRTARTPKERTRRRGTPGGRGTCATMEDASLSNDA